MKKHLLLLSLFFMTFVLQAQTVQYTTQNLSMREGPSFLYRASIKIPAGTRVEIPEVCDCEWTKILYKERMGYIQTKYLTIGKAVNRLISEAESDPSDGQKAGKPAPRTRSAPAGATALCRDGTYSYSANRRGTCSHHGGAARWLP